MKENQSPGRSPDHRKGPADRSTGPSDTPEQTHFKQLKNCCLKQIHRIAETSSIQTVLSALESHQILPFGSRAIPPVGNRTQP